MELYIEEKTDREGNTYWLAMVDPHGLTFMSYSSSDDAKDQAEKAFPEIIANDLQWETV